MSDARDILKRTWISWWDNKLLAEGLEAPLGSGCHGCNSRMQALLAKCMKNGAQEGTLRRAGLALRFWWRAEAYEIRVVEQLIPPYEDEGMAPNRVLLPGWSVCDGIDARCHHHLHDEHMSKERLCSLPIHMNFANS